MVLVVNGSLALQAELEAKGGKDRFRASASRAFAPQGGLRLEASQ